MRIYLAKISVVFNFGWMITHKLRSDIREARGHFTGRLLDIGCGTQPFRSIIGDQVDHYWGVELPGTLSRRTKVDTWADGMRLPFAADSFDVILCTQVMEHVTDPQMLLSETARVLKDEGHLVLTVPFMNGLHEEPHDYYRFSRYALEILLQRVGLRPVDIHAQGGFWLNFGQNFGFYLMDFCQKTIFIELPLRLIWGMISPFIYLLDSACRNERYTMNYFVVATKCDAEPRKVRLALSASNSTGAETNS